MRTATVAALFVTVPLAAQDDPRQIFDSYFGKSRPPADAAPAQARPQYRPAGTNQSVPVKKVSSGGKPGNALGVTIWKLDAPSSAGARLLVQTGDVRAEFTPHRIEAGEQLRLGDRIRLSIETPSNGYLYVADQEIHADDSLGPPYLIFPAVAARGGNNYVRAGQLIDIPEQTDKLNVFEVQAKSAGYSGDHLTVFLTPTPIPGMKAVQAAQKIPSDTFSSWVAQYRSEYQHLELVGGKGQAWTEAEQQAGQDGTRSLTLADPAPQSVFVFPEKAGKPIMVVVRLQVR